MNIVAPVVAFPQPLPAGTMVGQSGLTNFHSASTIGDLPGYEQTVSLKDATQVVFQLFDQSPELPAVIVRDANGRSILCRKDLLQILSRPFGNELFLNRSLASSIRTIPLKQFALPENTRIEEAITLALRRPPNELYDPLLVLFKSGRQMVLDFHVLLMAQTQMLEQANRFIRQQIETGYTLSHLMDVDQVLRQILNDLAEMIPYHYGSILLFASQDSRSEIATHLSTWPEPLAMMDPIYNTRIFADLLASRQPAHLFNIQVSNPDVAQPQEVSIDSWLGFPLIYSDQVIGMLSLTRLAQTGPAPAHEKPPALASPFTEADSDLIRSLSTTFTAAIRNAQLLNELHTLSETDPLAATLNRRGFFERASQWIHEAPRDAHFGLLILDIDHFKQVNDLYGHQLGDVVIQRVAAECQRQLRQSDLVGRYGGEEFIVLLPETDVTGALFVAERLRLAIANLVTPAGHQKISVTVSVGGMAFMPTHRSIDDLVRQADEALYAAKSKGRNCAQMWSDELAHTALTDLQQTFSLMEQSQAHSNEAASISPDLSTLLRREDLENESVLGFVRALEMREKEDRGHAQRVAELTLKFAHLANIPQEQHAAIYRGALLHDIGKIAIPDQILCKPDTLTAEEWESMHKHPAYAFQLLSTFSYLKDALEIPYCHHERWDGNGYPRGLKGEEIPLAARLFAIVDVWIALTSDRCYRKAWTREHVVSHIQDQSGRHFDPQLAELFLSHLDELVGSPR